MKHRYQIAVDYESSEEWGLGVVPSVGPGEKASTEEIAIVLEKVAALLREEFSGDREMRVRYEVLGGV